MAIGEICKFEVKEEIDRMVEKTGVSRNEAAKLMANGLCTFTGFANSVFRLTRKGMKQSENTELAKDYQPNEKFN